MRPNNLITFIIAFSLSVFSAGSATYDTLMKIKANAPGGAFTTREPLTFHLVNHTPQPTGYEVVNWKGEKVAKGKWPKNNTLTLSSLPPGHYQLKTESGNCSFAVLPQPATPAPETLFALDTHISWTGLDNSRAGYPGEAGFQLITELARRTGASHIRDRISWGPTNPARGTFRFQGDFNPASAAAQAKGLKVLSVYHDSPKWTDGGSRKMAKDLRAIYDYNYQLAKHFRGKIDNWEFWNEPDSRGFCDVSAWDFASAAKAASLGLKAGNPEITIHSAPYCTDTRFFHSALLSDLPQYFDVFGFHSYASADTFPPLMSAIRRSLHETGAPATMPIWFTEVGTYVEKDATQPGLRPGLREHSYQQELCIAREIPKSLTALQQLGVARIFWFNLMPVNERGGKKSFGLLRRDYTIKASYTAFANLNFQLGQARLEGAMNEPGVHALLYRQPDNSQSLIAWSKQGKKQFTIPGWNAKTALVDLFGTPVPLKGPALLLDENPVYIHHLANLSPATPAHPAGTPGAAPSSSDQTIVMKASFPESAPLPIRRNFLSCSRKPFPVKLELYNFSSSEKAGHVTLSGAVADCSRIEVKIPANGKTEVLFQVTPVPAPASVQGELEFFGRFNGRDISRLVVPFLLTEEIDKTCPTRPIRGMDSAQNWKISSSGKMTISDVPAERAVKFTVTFPEKVDQWAYPVYTLKLPQESLKGASGLLFEVKQLTPGKIKFARINTRWPGLWRLTGEEFAFPESEWQTRQIFFAPEFPADKIRQLEVGFNPAGKTFSWMIRNVRLFYLK